MAKGDPVLGTLATTGNFQPAAGVVVCITTLTQSSSDTAASWAYCVGGAGKGVLSAGAGATPNTSHVKMFIDNTQYLRLNTAVIASYGGVQVA